jgi:Ser/Thr protein kinase RdoA (MazF antagonist)
MMGELAARLHLQAEGFRPPAGFWIRSKNKVFPYGEEVVIFDNEQQRLFPPARRGVYQQAVSRVQGALDHLRGRDEAPRVIHNDLHQWNVKAYHSRLFPIDFEDLMWGHPVQDIAVTLYYFLGYDNYRQLRETYRHGYTMHRDWPEAYDGEIDTFIAGRGLTLVNFVVQDPDLKYRAMAPEYVERIEGRLVTLLGL